MDTPATAVSEIAEALRLGLEHQRSGRLVEAAESYRTVLAADPAHADALYLLGVVEQSAGHYQRSAELVEAAIRINPRAGDYHSNLGNTYKLLGDLPRAAESYRQAFALNRNNLYALDSLARVQAKLGKQDEAAKTCRLLLALKRRLAMKLCRLGDLEYRSGELGAAADHYQQSIWLQPNGVETHIKLAGTLFQLKQMTLAVHAYRRALALQPDSPTLHHDLGLALQANGQLREAAKAYHRVLELKPDDTTVLSNLAAVFTDLGNLELAAILLKRCLSIDPDLPVALCNFGTLLSKQGNVAAATECYKKAVELRPGYAAPLCNLGIQFELDGDLEAGDRYYRAALRAEPDFAQAHSSLSQIHLARGEFAAGWQEYEWRWETPKFRCIDRHFKPPRWRGEPIAGSRILVFNEQGLGDTMHFARYIPMLAAAGATVYFEVQPNVFPLLQHLEGAAQVIRRGDPLPQFDWQCPTMSLPLAFKTDLESIPHQVPYLRADEDQTRRWAKRLMTDGLKVGIAWCGNPNHTREKQRSLPLENLARLSRIPGTAFYSLQKGPAAGEVDALPAELRVVNLDAEQQDFADTAAIVANLDLIVTIDTSVAHLAGAMGKPVWILLHTAPDWRWLRDREDSPWYPTARLFRQTAPGDWEGVLDRVEAELSALAAARIQA